jgi:hypothetical protein
MLTLKMFLLRRILKGKQERENLHPPPSKKKKKKRTYKIPGVVKLKGRYVSLPRKVVRNNKNSVGR